MAMPRLPIAKATASTAATAPAQAPTAMKGITPSSLKSLSSIKMPKGSTSTKGPKLSAKTIAGKGAKPGKMVSTSHLRSTIKSIISAAKKGGRTSVGMGVPSSAVGAPATPPAPAFFGPSAPSKPNTFGLGM